VPVVEGREDIVHDPAEDGILCDDKVLSMLALLLRGLG
jgi:hypothetical protein